MDEKKKQLIDYTSSRLVSIESGGVNMTQLSHKTGINAGHLYRMRDKKKTVGIDGGIKLDRGTGGFFSLKEAFPKEYEILSAIFTRKQGDNEAPNEDENRRD